MQILIANTKGGCGKSTLTACLCDAMDADIMDHDPQGTLRVNAKFTNRCVPVSGQSSKPVIIHDTPPYNTTDLSSLIKEVDLVVIPTKLMYADLLALATIAKILEKLQAEKKAVIVFNEVRYHNKKLNEEVRALYTKNYPGIKILQTEIPNWIAYAKVLTTPLEGKALERIKMLVNELNTYKNIS